MAKAADGEHPATAARNGLFVIPRRSGGGFQGIIRGHLLELADPDSHGLAPTPDDLFVTSLASQLAWSTRTFLQANGLPDEVSVSATWLRRGDLPALTDVSLTVTVSSYAEAATATLAANFANSLVAQFQDAPVIQVSSQE